LGIFSRVLSVRMHITIYEKGTGKGVYLIQRHLRRRARPVALYNRGSSWSALTVEDKKDGYRQQNVRQRQKLISIIDYDVCITFY